MKKLLLVLFLAFSYLILSCLAVPSTRSLEPNMEEALSIHFQLQDDEVDVSEVSREELVIEGRMEMESTDYPGTGANNHHDPKAPGKP